MQFVIVVDTQVDFMRPDGALPVAGAEALVAPMHAWLATLEPAETAGVLFTFDRLCCITSREHNRAFT